MKIIKQTEIAFLTSDKSGILSYVMIKARKLGLVYQRNQTKKIDKEYSRLIVTFEGTLNCSTKELTDLMEVSPNIHAIESIKIDDIKKESMNVM